MLGWVLAMSLAAAAPCNTSNLRLDWVRAPNAASCPVGDHVAALVTKRLQCVAFGDDAQAWFEVWVEAAGKGWRARITRIDADGSLLSEKVLETKDPDCAVLGQAVAFTLAVVAERLPLRPVAVVATASVTVTSTQTTTSSAAERTRFVRAPFVPTSTAVAPVFVSVPPRGAVTAELVLNTGTLSEASFGIRVGGMLELASRWNLELGVLMLPVHRVRQFFFGLSAGYLGVCARFEPIARVGLSACARTYAGVLFGHVQPQVEPINPGAYFWMAGAPAAVFDLEIAGPVQLRLAAEALITFVDRVFETRDDQREVLNEPTITPVVSAGLIFKFR